ncbi:MAG: hypothetical protein WCE63_09800 [Acidobacteriaceae bacterium]
MVRLLNSVPHLIRHTELVATLGFRACVPHRTLHNSVGCDRLLFTMDEGQNEACLVICVETANVDPFGSPWELHL